MIPTTAYSRKIFLIVNYYKFLYLAFFPPFLLKNCFMFQIFNNNKFFLVENLKYSFVKRNCQSKIYLFFFSSYFLNLALNTLPVIFVLMSLFQDCYRKLHFFSSSTSGWYGADGYFCFFVIRHWKLSCTGFLLVLKLMPTFQAFPFLFQIWNNFPLTVKRLFLILIILEYI